MTRPHLRILIVGLLASPIVLFGTAVFGSFLSVVCRQMPRWFRFGKTEYHATFLWLAVVLVAALLVRHMKPLGRAISKGFIWLIYAVAAVAMLVSLFHFTGPWSPRLLFVPIVTIALAAVIHILARPLGEDWMWGLFLKDSGEESAAGALHDGPRDSDDGQQGPGR